MSEQERNESAMQDRAREPGSDVDEEEDDEDVGSPFDHPAFLPVLLGALTIWFAYDGWISTTIEAVNFNRYGTFFLVGFCIYFAATELTTARFLLPALYTAFALWLGAFSIFGDEDSWWRDGEYTVLFNQVGAGVCALAAVVLALREWHRGPPQPREE